MSREAEYRRFPLGGFFIQDFGRRDSRSQFALADLLRVCIAASASPSCRISLAWVLKGEPALVDSTSPRWGEKACYYSGVCLESGEVDAMEIAGNSNAETSTAFLQQLRENHPGPLVVIWDNGPAHRGEAIRSYLATPDLHLRLVALPAYSPDFNADEAVWDWAREEITANECLGTKAQVQEKNERILRRANTP